LTGYIQSVQWRAEGGDRPEHPRPGGIQQVHLKKLRFAKMLQLNVSSCCKATSTYSMDLKDTCLRGHANVK